MRKLQEHNQGYILEYSPNHPACTSKGYVFQHKLIMETHIGRYLTGREVVHHINEIRDDNRIENLFLFEDTRDHHRHHRGWIIKNGTWFKRCKRCERLLEVNETNWFYRKTGRGSGGPVTFCKDCARQLRNKWTQDNIEKKRISDRKYRANNLDRLRQRHRDYYKANRDAINKKRRKGGNLNYKGLKGNKSVLQCGDCETEVMFK